jgi:hypothetical protein
MSDPNTEQEPTMEEILSSIRRIISEDDEGAEEETSSDRVVNEEEAELAEAITIPGREPDEDDEPIEFDTAGDETSDESFDKNIIDLTEMVTEDGSVVSLKDGEAADAAAAPEADPEPESNCETEPGTFEEVAEDTDNGDLISDLTASAETVALALLASTKTPVHGQPLGGAGRTLEELVKELLDPMLRAWLDKNMPKLVERFVEKEISKLAHRVDDQ